MTARQQKSERPIFAPRPFRLVGEDVRERLIELVRQLPIDELRPLQVMIREEPPKRKLTQQALMWVGPLADIAEQAEVEGNRFSAETWHTYFKAQFLPEQFDPELCLDGYEKWGFDPVGDRVLTGSTTMLTVRGMSDFIEQIYAFGASLGVQFSDEVRR